MTSPVSFTVSDYNGGGLNYTVTATVDTGPFAGATIDEVIHPQNQNFRREDIETFLRDCINFIVVQRTDADLRTRGDAQRADLTAR